MQTKIETNEDTRLTDLSLIRGGPFYRFQEWTRLIHPNQWDLQRRLTFALAIGWVPLFLITVLFNSGALMSFLKDYRIHSRMLIAVPVLLLGQTLMDSRFRAIVEHIRKAHLLADGDGARLDDFIATLRRLRNSVLPELLILFLVVVHTSISAQKLVDASPWLATGNATVFHLTPAGWYAVLVSASIFQFLLGLSLWKWLLWSLFAFRLSRLDLKLIPTHSDEHGGLGFLSLTPVAFAPISFATTAVIAATWRHEILLNHAHLIDYKLPGIALVVIIVLLALLPLLFFVPRLAALRRAGILEYSILGQIQTTQFHEKWITQGSGRESQVLTTMESSNVIDYSQTYDRVKRLIPIPVDVGTLIPLAATIAIPALPMIFAEIPVAVVLRELLGALR
jgi:hypothetical protein